MKEYSQWRTKIIGWIFHQINSRRRKFRVVFIQGIVPKNTAQSVFGAICLYFEYSREVFLWIFLLLPLSRLLERQVHKKNDQLPICSMWKKRKIFLITECCVCGVTEIIFCFSSVRFEFSCIFYVIFQYYEHFQMSSVWIDFVNTLGMLVTIVWWMQIIFSEVFVRHRTFSHLEERKNVYKKYFLCTTYANENFMLILGRY